MCTEITDIDQIYQVLKQAGEISSSKTTEKPPTNGTGQQQLSSIQQDIPILNVPECPERVVHQRRGQIKPHSQNAQAANNSLAAPPLTDLSSSGVNNLTAFL